MKGLALIMISALLLPHDVVLIVGKRGSGKSSKAKALIAEQLALGARVLAYDPKDEYSMRGRARPNVDLGPLTDRCTVDELLSNPELLHADTLSLAVVPTPSEASKEPEDYAADVKDLHGLVEQSGNLTFALDEVGLYEAEARQTLKILATQSRHYGDSGVPVILVAQRAVLIPKSARDMASIIYTGVQTDPDDLAALRKLVRSSLGDEEAEKFVDAVAVLPRPGILEWHEGGKTL